MAVEYGTQLLSTGEFPHLSALNQQPDADAAGPPMTHDALADQFEHGLAALLDGLAAQMKLD